MIILYKTIFFVDKRNPPDGYVAITLKVRRTIEVPCVFPDESNDITVRSSRKLNFVLKKKI